jgi:hypothetical protein
MCARSWRRIGACADAGAADRHSHTAAARSAFDPAPNPGLHVLRVELRHHSGPVPRRVQRQQFAYSDICRGRPRSSHSVLSKLHKPTARLQTGVPGAALKHVPVWSNRGIRERVWRLFERHGVTVKKKSLRAACCLTSRKSRRAEAPNHVSPLVCCSATNATLSSRTR